jgi:hypothetical protein
LGNSKLEESRSLKKRKMKNRAKNLGREVLLLESRTCPLAWWNWRSISLTYVEEGE